MRVRGLHRHDRPVERIGRGSRAAINLVGVHHTEIRRGQELAAPGYRRGDPHSLGRGGRIGGGRSPACGIAGATSSTWGRPRSRPSCRCWRRTKRSPGMPQLAQLFVAEPVVAVHGQPFVLRAESPPATLGGGRVVQPWSAPASPPRPDGDRSPRPLALGRSRSSACAPPWHFSGSRPGPSAGSAR